MKKMLLIASALAFACGSLFATGNAETSGSTAKVKPIVLKIALQNGESHPLCKGVAKFADLVKEKSDGRITMQLFYSGALGSKTSTVQGMQTGTIDGAMLMGGVIADYGPDVLKVFTLPYLFDSVEHARHFEKSADGRALLDAVQSSGSRMVCIGAYQESARNYFFVKKDVKKPSDMRNLMVRCQEGEVYYDAAESLGANVQSVAFSELYSALQSGVVDGAEQPLSGFINNAFQEVAKYYVLDQHEISPNLILMSEITWNKLSAEDKALISQCFDESVPYFEQISDAKDVEYLAQIKAAGVKVTEVDVSQWQKACESVYAKYGPTYGDLIKKIKASR